jgi:uncharacterized protein (DUF58 family)
MGRPPRQPWWRWLLSWLLPAAPPPHWRWWLPAEGRCWLALTLILVTLGLVKGLNLLLLFGYLMLVVVALNAIAVRWQLPPLKVRRHVEEPVFAGSACPVQVDIASARGAIRGVRIEDTGPNHDPATWFLSRLGRGEVTLRASTVFHRRGRSQGGELAVVRGYPFGLVLRRVVLQTTDGVIVLPRLGWVHPGRLRQLLRHASPQDDCVRRHRPQRHPSAQAEFHGLRPWRAGDSPRSIHWRTSARCGELMVREFEDEPSDNLILIFDPALPSGVTMTARFEEAVSLAATICWAWCRQKGERLILAVAAPEASVLDDVPGPSHARQVLQALALVEPGPAVDGPALAHRLAGFADVPAACIVLGAGPSPLVAAISAALRREVVALHPGGPEVDEFYEAPGERRGQIASVAALDQPRPTENGSVPAGSRLSHQAGAQDARMAGAVVDGAGQLEARKA